MLGLTSSSKLDRVSYVISIAKTASKKIGALTRSMKFALYLYKSTISPYMEYVVTSGLVPLIATWNCLTSYKNEYEGLLVLHLLPFLNPWLIIEMWPA